MLGKLMLPESRFVENIVYRQVAAKITRSVEKMAKVERGIMRKYLARPIMDYRSMDELRELAEPIHAEINKHMNSSFYNNHANKDAYLHLLKLRESNEEWTIAFDTTIDITTIHDKDFNIIMANKAFYDAYNIDEKQLNKRKYNELFYGADNPSDNCILARCVVSLKPECEEGLHYKIKRYTWYVHTSS